MQPFVTELIFPSTDIKKLFSLLSFPFGHFIIIQNNSLLEPPPSPFRDFTQAVPHTQKDGSIYPLPCERTSLHHYVVSD